jgi:oligopeptide/dipeptide ABC transporter ATP-binding protein
MTIGKELLRVTDLSVEFYTDHGWERVVKDVSFSINAGETLGIVGESGSGKSVTSMALTRLIPMPPGRIASGSVVLEGTDLVNLDDDGMNKVRGAQVANIFQEPMTSLNPAFTVGEQIAEMVRFHEKVGRKAAWARAVEMLTKVGIPNAASRAKEYPHQFSGGMRQRVMIAMAMSCTPKLLIADEPTTALDVTIQAQVLDLIKDMQSEFEMAVIFITHDLGVVAQVCDRVVVMYAGQVVEQAEISDLYFTPAHPYAEGLLNSMPQIGPRSGRLASIPGSTPLPSSLPDGCSFAPRCPYVIDGCREGEIPLRSIHNEQSNEHLTRCVRAGSLRFLGAS